MERRGREERKRGREKREGGIGGGKEGREESEEWAGNEFANKPSCTVGDVGYILKCKLMSGFVVGLMEFL